jgi:hypothetical protein
MKIKKGLKANIDKKCIKRKIIYFFIPLMKLNEMKVINIVNKNIN